MTLAIAPFPIEADLGKWIAYGIYLVIGLGFGAALEVAGFGYSPNLAAQFYGKDMRVFKVMFGAVIVAMTLVFFSSSVGLLDYRQVYVDPTYLWPGIVGGFIMGLGFVIGGFCPGTSLTAAGAGSIDGLFYLGGVLTGIFAFGESVDSIKEFWYGWDMGRFTLPQWLGWSTGTIVLVIAIVGVLAIFGVEKLEKRFGGEDPKFAPKGRYVWAVVVIVFAIATAAIGQPGWQQRWARIAAEKNEALANREVQIEPGELLELMNNNKIKLVMLDVRPEAEYNLFHLAWARHVTPTTVAVDALTDELLANPPQTAVITMSNDEEAATQAWKVLVAEGVPNVYILGGGLNEWLSIFAGSDIHPVTYPVPNDQPRFVFTSAIGSAYSASNPNPDEYELEYTPKVELAAKAAPSAGGCG
jgi:rhodanese-related sulfurtransferase/uncharacterized membrane protein YedE/YeeE